MLFVFHRQQRSFRLLILLLGFLPSFFVVLLVFHRQQRSFRLLILLQSFSLPSFFLFFHRRRRLSFELLILLLILRCFFVVLLFYSNRRCVAFTLLIPRLFGALLSNVGHPQLILRRRPPLLQLLVVHHHLLTNLLASKSDEVCARLAFHLTYTDESSVARILILFLFDDVREHFPRRTDANTPCIAITSTERVHEPYHGRWDWARRSPRARPFKPSLFFWDVITKKPNDLLW